MYYEERRQNLFDMPNEYYFAQCISADFGMGKGIAVQFNKQFQTKQHLIQTHGNFLTEWDNGAHGHCILQDRVLNLITKRNYWEKPTYNTMQSALHAMRDITIQNNIKHIAMPAIGCGLDRLNWTTVSEMIQQTFATDDIEIIVCHL